MKTLIAATAAFMLSAFAAGAANAQWVGYAVNDYGFGKAYGSSEVGARNAAIERCEQNTSRTCEDDQTYSVSVRVDSWYIVAIKCGGSRAVAGSEHSFAQAKRNAAVKLGVSPGNCSITHQE